MTPNRPVTSRRVALGLAALSLVLAFGCGDDTTLDPPDGGALPATASCEGYRLVGAEEAVDLATGLRWDTFAELSLLTHEEATARCQARGKRLPTREELLAMRREAADPCQLPACPFRGDRCATIQCGSPIPGTDAHWGVAFVGGALVSVPAGQPEVALCVGDPQP